MLDDWGLGYDVLKTIKPDIIYVQQSGMGGARHLRPLPHRRARSRPRSRALSEMSGLPEPAMPAGWGYSYLDWMGAYSFALAMLGALYHRERTGEGPVDRRLADARPGSSSPAPPILDWSANDRVWTRIGNRSPYKPAAPHGAYRCAGDDRWIAIACFTEAEWQALAEVAGHPEWLERSALRDACRRGSRIRTRSMQLVDALDRARTTRYDCMHALQAGRRAGRRVPDRGGSLRQRPAAGARSNG